MTLYCATTNHGKLREFRLAAALHRDWTIEALALGGLPAPKETGATFEENAILKARYYAAHAPGPLMAEDSGLAVDALGGEPGIYSARFAGEHATDSLNNQRLLQRLAGHADRRARYVCAIALVMDGEVAGVFRGEMEGQILESPRGAGGFGYDPLFYYPPFGQTLAEVRVKQTFEESHRRRALDRLFGFLSARKLAQ